MKKVVLAVLFVILVFPLGVFALSNDYGFTYGDWEIMGNRLYQEDEDCGIAKAWMAYPQQGIVEYNFNVRYEGGMFEDGHAGFGIHLFVDKPAKGFSWGEGKSYLLWVNYDRNPVSKSIPKGLSVEIYESSSNSRMKLVQAVDLSRLEKTLMAIPRNTVVPVRMVANGRTGEIRIYDPLNTSYYYTLNLGNRTPLKGSYVTLRTNGGAFSFGY